MALTALSRSPFKVLAARGGWSAMTESPAKFLNPEERERRIEHCSISNKEYNDLVEIRSPRAPRHRRPCRE
jgi:hypothetical protein